MIWHEIVCDECCNTAPGKSSTGNVNAELKKEAERLGWYIGKNGYAACPICRKRKGL